MIFAISRSSFSELLLIRESFSVEATYSGPSDQPVQIILPLGATCFTLTDVDLADPNLQFIVTSSEATEETNFSQLIDSTVVQAAANTSRVFQADPELEHLKEQLTKTTPRTTRSAQSVTLTEDDDEAAQEVGASFLTVAEVEVPASRLVPAPDDTPRVDEHEGRLI